MINLLFIFLLYLNPPSDCDLNFERFISANQLDASPKGDNAYLLKLRIRTELNNQAQNNIDQELTAMIHDEGFCMKSEEVLIIGDNDQLLIIMPRTRTIIKSKYDVSQLPDFIKLSKYQYDRLAEASNKSCELVNRQDNTSLLLSADFDNPLIIQGELADKVKYTVDQSTYKLQRVELTYQPNQKIHKQIIQYVKQDLECPKAQALRWNNVFKKDGKLQREFLHYEIIEQ